MNALRFASLRLFSKQEENFAQDIPEGKSLENTLLPLRSKISESFFLACSFNTSRISRVLFQLVLVTQRSIRCDAMKKNRGVRLSRSIPENKLHFCRMYMAHTKM